MAIAQNITIRLAKDADFDAVYSIWLDGIHNSFDSQNIDLEKVKQKFASNFFERKGVFNFWVAVDNDDVVLGWQSLSKCSNNPFKENTYAESSTYISKCNRYKGLGKALLDYVMNIAENSELEYIIGFVAISNEPAKKITEDTGWHIVGQIPDSKKRKSKIIKSFLVRPV